MTSDPRHTMTYMPRAMTTVKWYNFKRGFGFIADNQTGKDVFAHISGLTRSLRRRLPREGKHSFSQSIRKTRDLRPEL
ncbi:Cold shock protein ScoF [Portunus trituberculatus]|uniref:Cold shock protein ScoF n=1 Tax=Portunus trituberculatus TaxID=210409 RepID=A0A5B7JHX0_PORTR|nr:Cold shock protein ScoF [Portunus trituberculatus]